MKSSKLVLTGIAILMCVILVFTKLNGRRKQGRDLTNCNEQQGQLQNASSAPGVLAEPYESPPQRCAQVLAKDASTFV